MIQINKYKTKRNKKINHLYKKILKDKKLMKEFNEWRKDNMKKVDENGNVQQEYLDFVHNLKREDLEKFYIGADLLIERVKKYLKSRLDEWETSKNDDDSYYNEILEDTYILNLLNGKENKNED